MKAFLLSLILSFVISHSSRAEEILSLAPEFVTHVKKIKHSVYTYHYVSRAALGVPSTGLLNLNLPSISEHVSKWADYFWDPSQKDRGYGRIRGLYLANEPVISRDFGKDDWILFRVELEAGTTYLDLNELEQKFSENQISKSVLERLISSGCDATFWSQLILGSFNPACRKISLQTLRDLNVALLDYNWGTSDFPTCMNHANDTFILIKPTSLAKNAVRVFYQEKPMIDAEEVFEQRMLRTFYDYVRPQAIAATDPQRNPSQYVLWKNITPGTPEEFSLYLKSHIFGCQ